jgi:hypothetical protein
MRDHTHGYHPSRSGGRTLYASASIISVVLCGAIIGAFTMIHFDGRGKASANDARWEDLESRIAILEEKLSWGMTDRSRIPPDPRVPPPTDTGGASTEGFRSTAQERPTVASQPPEDLGRLRQFVEAIITERDRVLRAREEETERKIAELSEGPYGPLNIPVNTMAAYLDLTTKQKEAFVGILETMNRSFEDEIAATMADGMIADDSVGTLASQHEAISEAVGRRFEIEVQAMLSPDQRERFRSLPPEQRRFDGMVLVALPSTGGFVGQPKEVSP